ncbi:hypothetical protein CVU37_00415 [candidate division BRC1 bacterium HGW-BRC1-1]|jgi:type I restriction enzyme S subunit|nr:MAG: hypothetical protein CVU37_00415 [candidate division BRC1 bacterium HGW-BRC1-1]
MIGRQLGYAALLPAEWEVTSVGEIGTYLNGYAFKPEQWGANGDPIIRIQNLNDRNKPFNYFDGEVPDKYRIRNGDILVSWSASLGTFRWDRGDAWLNQHIFKASPNLSSVTDEFFYWVMVHGIERIAENARGSTMKHVTGKEFNNSEVAIPPLLEQKKIAHILSTVQQAIEAQERIIQTTTELKKALMHKLFTQGLRNEPQKQTEIGPIPQSWEVLALSEIAESFQYGTSVKCAYDVKGKAVLRIPNVVGGAVDISDLKFGKPKSSEITNLRLQSGDLLFVRTNGVQENAGRCSLFENEIVDCYFASYLIRVRLDSHTLNPSFLNEYSRTETGTSFLSGKAIRTADGKFNINSGTLKTMLVPVPGIEEQEEIATMLSLIDTKSSSARAKLSALQDLFRTLLHELMTAKTRVHELEISA